MNSAGRDTQDASIAKQVPTHRLPCLDGLRAVAVFMVIALHVSQRFSAPDSQVTAKTVLLLKNLQASSADGVGIFFVLSGFLITSLLVREFDTTGRISFSKFYLRRTLRILPPLYAYLMFVIFFCTVVQYPLHWSTIAGSALFYQNYFPSDGQWLTEHTWSLCVEEQFYLLWPIGLVWSLHRGGRVAAVRLAAALIVIAPFLRIATKASHLQMFDHRLGYLLHTRMDALMAGCLLALLIGTPRFESFYRRIEKFGWLLPLEFTVISGVLTFVFGVNYRNSIGYTVDSVFVAFFIVWAVRNEHSRLGSILNARVMTACGVLSYSAYIWQTFFIHSANPTWAGRMPWAVAFIWIAAALSHVLIEVPALRLRKLIEARMVGSTVAAAGALPQAQSGGRESVGL